MDPQDERERFERRRTELRLRLQRLQADLTRADEPLERDFAEQAVQRENDEVLAALAASARAELARIDRALRKLEQGTYGRCAECGERIEPGRLAAMPDAERCVACAE